MLAYMYGLVDCQSHSICLPTREEQRRAFELENICRMYRKKEIITHYDGLGKGEGKGRKDHQFSDGVMLNFWAFRSQGIPSRFCRMLQKASRFVLLAILLFLGIYPGITLGTSESRSRLFEYVHTLPYLLLADKVRLLLSIDLDDNNTSPLLLLQSQPHQPASSLSTPNTIIVIVIFITII